jgi:branched-chain amino acid transport system ATP-binding protein
VLSLRNLEAHYGKLQALRGVSIEVPKAGVIAILGSNAAGKSTVMKAISGLKELSSGEIWFEGKRIDGMPSHEIVGLGIAQVPEGRRIFADMSVLDNLMMGAHWRTQDRASIPADLEEIFATFPILRERRYGQAGLLSGGEQEMLAIGRALMAKPRLLLLDEPCQGLSPRMMEEVERIILMLRGRDIAIVLVEHNIRLAVNVAQWIYVIEEGQIVLEGPPDEMSETSYVKRVYLAG